MPKGDWVKALTTIASKVPFSKLTRNQVFDLTSDAVMVGLAFASLRSDLGQYRDYLKVFLVVGAAAFILWSSASNR
jgi:hypothetical protein